VGWISPPPVDAQFLDEQPQLRLPLLRLGVGDDAVEFVGDAGEFGRCGRMCGVVWR
jgi:hypothetical protein